MAIAPNGRLAAVTTAFWDKPGLAIVDLHAAAVRHRVKVGPAPFDVGFTPSGRRIVVSGGEQEGSVHILETKGFTVTAHQPIGTVPRGLAVAGEEDAWIALNGLDRVVGVDLKTGRIRRRLVTPELPDRVAVSPDGKRLLISHGGRDAQHVTEINIATGRKVSRQAGRLPSAVAYTRSGRALVALGGAGQVAVFGKSGRARRLPAGAAPRGLAVAGRRAWTVDALTGDGPTVRT